jgi:hypothetical protein
MADLFDFLATSQPGEIPPSSGLDRLLAGSWTRFRGSDQGGMQAYKLLGRMEQVRWQPPILSFVLERHGGRVMGSTRAELQHWEVDLETRTVRIGKTGHRQLESMAPRVSIKQLAEQVAERILSGEIDERIKRLDDGSVKVLVSKLFPPGSGFQRTVSGRRKRLIRYVAETLAPAGWVETVTNVFKPPAG